MNTENGVDIYERLEAPFTRVLDSRGALLTVEVLHAYRKEGGAFVRARIEHKRCHRYLEGILYLDTWHVPGYPSYPDHPPQIDNARYGEEIDSSGFLSVTENAFVDEALKDAALHALGQVLRKSVKPGAEYAWLVLDGQFRVWEFMSAKWKNRVIAGPFTSETEALAGWSETLAALAQESERK